ncbi:MAG: hypothetical protein ACYS18_05895 [Planctomycetota bacterium]
MKIKNLTISFALLFAAAFMLTVLSVGLANADEQEREDIWTEDRAGWEGGHPAKASPERIERLLDRIAENNPERAKELRKLKEENPEQFRTELRELMRRRFEERSGSHSKGRPRREGGGPFERDGRSRMRERMMDRHAEYIEWLEQNYLEEAEKLQQLRDKDPDLYRRQIRLSVKKYGRIAEASRENPGLAELLKKDFELKRARDELVEQIADSKETERQELVKELEEIISQRFDLIVERKQIEYDQLREKLEQLKKKVEESESKVEKWKDPEFKQQNIKTRVEKLIDDAQEFRWH